jgi:hypothetical protein
MAKVKITKELDSRNTQYFKLKSVERLQLEKHLKQWKNLTILESI